MIDDNRNKIKLLKKLITNQTKIMIISVLGLVLVLIGGSYAVFSAINRSGNYNVISVGTLDITFDDTSTGLGNIINLSGAYPVSDTVGEASTPYKFKVTNTGTFATNYTIRLEDDEAMITADECASNLLAKSNVKYKVDTGNTSLLSSISGSDYTISTGSLEPDESRIVELRMWIKSDATNDVLGKHFHIKIVIDGTVKGFLYTDDSGASEPKLLDGMIPVIYEATTDTTGNWMKADLTTPWYDYDEQRWANAVLVSDTTLLTANAGTIIPESSILAYFVWIPRFSYTIKNNYGNTLSDLGGSSASNVTPGAIDVKFVSRFDTIENGGATYTGDVADYYTHPAFCFGTLTEDEAGNNVAQGENRTSCDGEEVNGFWIGKFETTTETQTSGNVDSCLNTSCTTKLTIKPNYVALNNQNIASLFNLGRSMQVTNYAYYNLPSAVINPNYDIHMLKNMEWGAVAYLSQSIYGKYGNPDYTGANKEIYQNKSFSTSSSPTITPAVTSYSVTGNSNGSPSIHTYNTSQYAYNDLSSLGTGLGQVGAGASTTGNIYGVYDMSGGILDLTMGNMRDNSITTKVLNLGNAGTLDLATKYFDSYLYGTTITDVTAYARGLKGDATKEMHPTSSGRTWYNDYANVVSSTEMWFVRGGASSDGLAGIFRFAKSDGGSLTTSGLRIILKP